MRQRLLFITGSILMFLYLILSIVYLSYLVTQGSLMDGIIFNVGANFICIIFCLVLFFSVYFDKSQNIKSKYLFMALLLLAGTNLAITIFFYLFKDINDKFNIVVCSLLHYLFLLIGASFVLMFWHYIVATYFLKDKFIKILGYILAIICVVDYIYITSNIFFNHIFFVSEDGIFNRGKLYFSSLIFLLISFSFIITLIIKYKKLLSIRTILSIAFYLIISVTARVINIYYINLAISYVGITIVLLLVYSNIYLQKNYELEANKTLLEKQKLDNAISRVEPHFMFNVLSSIYYIVDKDPKLAKEAINDFSKYMRDSIESIDKPQIISFKEELEYCRNYLSLEQMRYGDELSIHYDLKIDDFFVLRFSLQPIIENAIKHGTSQNKNGGNLWIESYSEDKYNIVCIRDDGPGFDINILNSTNRIGIKNVKYRIQNLIHGDIIFESIENKGTVVKVYFPKEVSDEYFGN